MKKFLALLLAAMCCVSLCVIAVSADESDPFAGMEVMTHDEYIAAENDDPVVIESYVQATQSWWDNKITVYLQDETGAYFAYEMACSEEDAAKLVPGTKIQIKGYKGEWAGEVEIMDATFTFVEGAEPYVAQPADLTDVLANEEELIKHQNELAIFNGLTVEKIEYKNGEPGDDIYVTVRQGANSFSFCVERYLTGPDTAVYKAFEEIKAGDIVNVTGFVYWYNGVNAHITSVEVVQSVMTHDEYIAAELDAPVVVETYVQATQSWWDNKITAYLQDESGAYLAYEMYCTEEDAEKLVPGTKIIVTGYKGEWSGEVEIVDATFMFADGDDKYVAQPADLTDVLANEEELIKHQNELAIFKGLTIDKIEYKNGEPGDDIYVTVKQGDKTFSFCVERYLTDPETDVYKAFADLEAGDEVNVTGFVYWYNGVNTHITAVEVIESETEAQTDAKTEASTTPETDATGDNGCGSSVTVGAIAIASVIALGFVSFRKKED
ncbi:MAG: hypothetical protein J6L83_03795 [Clostridia bacterium]|nr:hypothetical protein [Clostridia bacterium]